MDISDQQMKQLAAGPAHSFVPLNYMQSLQSVESFSPHFPNYHIMQPPLIMSSSNINEISSINKAPDTAAAHSSSPCVVFNPGNNVNVASIGAGLDQIPGLYKATFDYSVNQIYDDQSHMFNIAGVAEYPNDGIHSTEKSTDLNHDQMQGRVSADPYAPTKPILSSAGCLGTAFASHEASQLGCEDACRPVDSTRKIVKLEPEMNHFAVSSYSSASRTGTSFLHSLVDMESLKAEQTYNFDQRSAFDHIDAVASTSSSGALDQHHHHHHHHNQFFDFSNLPCFSAKDLSPAINITSHQATTNDSLLGINEKHTIASNIKALSSSHVGTGETTISTPTRCKTQVAPKRRKSQQKRVVCVPATGGVDRPTGECLPSDSWAWRKYGQKPIKNSPYPRSYYKCSSVKGCTARKQVERNPSDPLTIIITYTVEHSHPASSTAAAADQPKPPKAAHEDEDEENADKRCTQADKQIMISADGADAISEESCEPISSEGTYHDTNNEETMIIESAHDPDDHKLVGDQILITAYQNDAIDEQRGGSNNAGAGGVSTAHAGLTSSSSNYLGTLKKTYSSHELTKGKVEEDVFSQLDELPDLFVRNPGWPSDTGDHGAITTTHINIDPFDLYCWH